METEEPASVSKEKSFVGVSRLSAGLEVTARAVAIFAAVVYGAGFLIVAIHHAQYGIAQFDPLRPKIFSTGIVFLLLIAIPTIAAFRAFQLSGLTVVTSFGIPYKPENRHYLNINLGLLFLLAAQALSAATQFLFEPGDAAKPWGVTCFLVLIALVFTLGSFARKYFNDHPVVFTVGNFLLMLSLIVVWYRLFDHRDFALNLWFYGVGIGAVVLYKSLQPGIVNKIEWERQFPILTIVLLTYSTLIYGRIKPSFGGGVPTPAVFYFTAKTPISNADSAAVLLLEETDHGYYVLPNEQEKSAYFIRRDLVSVIHFQKKEK